MVYSLADALGRPLEEIEAMSPDEFTNWFAYFKIKADRSKPKRTPRKGK